jgi:hypothetical protein
MELLRDHAAEARAANMVGAKLAQIRKNIAPAAAPEDDLTAAIDEAAFERELHQRMRDAPADDKEAP